MSRRNPLKRLRSIRFGQIISIALALIVAALFAAGGFALWRATAQATILAKSAADQFSKTFNFVPEVRINSIILVSPTKPALELVTAEKQMLIRHNWTNTWLHSTKSVEVEATFTARAGFDLSEPFRLALDPRAKLVFAGLPPAKILNISMGDIHILRDEDGYWNKLTAEDRERALNELQAQAKTEFEKSDIIAAAQAEVRQRITAAMQDKGRVVFEEVLSAP